MFLVAQTCTPHEYEAVDGQPITEARKCTKCGQYETYSPTVKLWLDASGMPCSADPGGTEPPRAA
jgi:hypothetical protein